MNGTTTWDTFAILLIPPINTRATQRLSISEAITTVHEYVPIPGIVTACAVSGSKKFFTAEAIPFTCENVPIPKRPTHTPKKANRHASHFHFFPIPLSM